MKFQSHLSCYTACVILILPGKLPATSQYSQGFSVPGIPVTRCGSMVRLPCSKGWFPGRFDLENLNAHRNHEPEQLISHLSGTLSAIPNGGEGWGEEARFMGIMAQLDSEDLPRTGKTLSLSVRAAASEKPKDPFSRGAKVTVLVFVHPECPIANRYAPEIQRLSSKFEASGVIFWLVYPDSDFSEEDISKHAREYRYSLPVIRDETHKLVKKSKVRVTPEAAVFDARGRLLYHGRIDDRYVDFGKARPEPTHRDLQNAIEACLAGKRLTEKETHAIGCNIWEKSNGRELLKRRQPAPGGKH